MLRRTLESATSLAQRAGFGGDKVFPKPAKNLTGCGSPPMTNLGNMLRQMSVLKANSQRFVAGLVLFLIVCGLGITLLEWRTPLHDRLGQASYDYLHQLGGEKSLGDSPVVIVFLDL